MSAQGHEHKHHKKTIEEEVGLVSIWREQMHIPDLMTAFAAGSLVGSQASAATACDLLSDSSVWPEMNLNLDPEDNKERETLHWTAEEKMRVAVKTQIYAPLLLGTFETALYLLDTALQKQTQQTNLRQRPSAWRYVVYTALGIALGIGFVYFAPHRRNSVSLYVILSFALFFGYFLSNVNWYLGCRRKRKT